LGEGDGQNRFAAMTFSQYVLEKRKRTEVEGGQGGGGGGRDERQQAGAGAKKGRPAEQRGTSKAKANKQNNDEKGGDYRVVKRMRQ
jgi:hypothetical protein